jgi:hypothetical protein
MSPAPSLPAGYCCNRICRVRAQCALWVGELPGDFGHRRPNNVHRLGCESYAPRGAAPSAIEVRAQAAKRGGR